MDNAADNDDLRTFIGETIQEAVSYQNEKLRKLVSDVVKDELREFSQHYYTRDVVDQKIIDTIAARTKTTAEIAMIAQRTIAPFTSRLEALEEIIQSSNLSKMNETLTSLNQAVLPIADRLDRLSNWQQDEQQRTADNAANIKLLTDRYDKMLEKVEQQSLNIERLENSITTIAQRFDTIEQSLVTLTQNVTVIADFQSSQIAKAERWQTRRQWVVKLLKALMSNPRLFWGSIVGGSTLGAAVKRVLDILSDLWS